MAEEVFYKISREDRCSRSVGIVTGCDIDGNNRNLSSQQSFLHGTQWLLFVPFNQVAAVATWAILQMELDNMAPQLAVLFLL